MPRVPSISSQVNNRVQPRPMDPGYQSGAGASADAFGAGVGRGLQQLGSGLQSAADVGARIATQIKIEEQERKAKEQQVAFRQGLAELWQGTEQQPGFSSLKGEAAVAAVPQYKEAIRELKGKHLEGVSEGLMVQLRHNFDMLEMEEMGRAFRHVQQERQAANQAASEANLNMSLEAAVRSYNDPEAIAREERRGLAEIAAFWSDKGVAPEVIATKKLDFSSTLHSGVIDRMLADDDVSGATAYFRQSQERIDARLHGGIRKKLDNAKEQVAGELLARLSANKAFVSTFGKLPASYAADQAALDALPGERGRKAAAEHRQLGRVLERVREFQSAPLDQQQAHLRELYENAASPEELPLFSGLAQSLDATQKAIRDGSVLDLYRERGEIELEELDYRNPASLAAREVTARNLSERLGVPVSPLAKAEVDGLLQRIENASAEQIGAAFAALTQKDGFSEEAVGAIAHQIVSKRPAYAAALHLSRYNHDLAADIIQGERLLRENSELKPTAGQLRDVADGTGLNQALILSPEARAAYLAAASALYVERTTSGATYPVPGLLWGTNEVEYELDHAVQEVTGMIEYNGQPIIPPRGMGGTSRTERQDRFEDLINRLTDDHLDERGNGSARLTSDFTIETIRDGDATFVTVAPGVYQVLIPGLGYVSVKDYKTGEIVTYQLDLNNFNPPPREVRRPAVDENLERMRQPLVPNRLFGRE